MTEEIISGIRDNHKLKPEIILAVNMKLDLLINKLTPYLNEILNTKYRDNKT